MTYGSLFAGVGGFDLGFEMAGFRCLWQVECDRTANDVRRRHWPNVEHIRDVVGMTRLPKRLGDWRDRWERPDVIIGGFPCQDLSVAGKRAGLAGNRSGLWWQMLRVIRGLRPSCVVFENVPGLLSSDRGRDFARVLLSLGNSGYRGGWRVLDAQHFGVPQRRRRVFGVFFGGHSGERRAAQVLAFRDGLCGDSPASRASGEVIAGSLGGGSGSRGWSDDLDRSGAFVTRPLASCLTRREGKGPNSDADSGNLIAIRTNQTGSNGSNVSVGETPTLGRDDAPAIAFNWNATNAAAGKQTSIGLGNLACALGTGQVPAAVTPIDMRQASRGATMTNNRREGSYGGAPGTGIGNEGDPCFTLAHSHVPAIAFQERGRDGGRSLDTQADLAYALTAPNGGGRGQERLIAHSLTANGFDASKDGTGRGTPLTPAGATVRRLTPRECERLMGWPDDWTRYRFDGSEVADGPRYRLCGNGVVAPVAEWLARRLMAVMEGS